MHVQTKKLLNYIQLSAKPAFSTHSHAIELAKTIPQKKDQYKLNMFSLLLTGRCQRAKPSASYSPNFFLHNPGSDKEKFS